MRNKAIFLDRDGVLNEVIVKDGKPYPPARLEELIISEDVPAALDMLKSLGYMLIGATNQPDVARGTTEKNVVESINQFLMSRLPLNEIRVCYHDDADGCACRKPMPGLIVQAAKDFDIDLSESVMIGDRWKDIEAGYLAGCKTIWLNRGYQETQPKRAPHYTTQSLIQASMWIKENLQKGELNEGGC